METAQERTTNRSVPSRRLIAALFLVTLASVAAAQAVYVIPIHGDIEPSTAVFVRRQATKAIESGAGILIFDIDTFGGRVDSALRISSFIGSIRKAQTVAYVRSGPDGMGVSWSAGALIAMSCSSLYMAPGTSIGAAAPVVAGPDGTMEGAGEKSVSAVRAQMSALAEKNGYPTSVALAMVDADVELYEMEAGGRLTLMTAEDAEAAEKTAPDGPKRGRLVSGKGKLLSLTAGEAERYGLSSGTVFDVDALLGAKGLKGPAVEMAPTVADGAVAFITSAGAQSLLILIGLVAIFIEINSPGFGLPGTVALIAFLVLFGANALMGSVGSLELVLFIVGVALLAVEIFLLPGFGVTGVSGIVIIAASLVLSMQDFVLPTLDWEWELLGRNVLTVVVGILSAIAAIGVLALAGPRIRMFDRMTLNTAISDTAGGRAVAGTADAVDAGPSPDPLVGKKGTALTTLRPSGRAEIAGRAYSVETEGTFVEAGAALTVTSVAGSRIIVTQRKNQ
ncbi:MAG: hypothetical protein CVV47_14015 [Spirochaetae bacterium HGW-Spirochaetae-3]|jgi:membrane-bound serine protease (ClpP class)|nr:MAG: hypothetical protein CVV47_14015 [Spirochaetae bacterium HGW-Spirochaetae-3]